MKILCTLIFLIVIKHSFGCVCAPLPEFKSKEDLKGYDFIALVQIKQLAPKDSARLLMRKDGHIGIEVLELFKGESINLLYDPGFNSDCTLSLENNEQWIFFGTIKNGKVEVYSCSYSVKYREANGIREWQYFTGIKQLNVLRSIYGYPTVANNIPKQLYPNGNIEIEQHFSNGQLNGTRKIYYPDGKIFITEDFKNGVRVGFRNYYGKSGQLLKSVSYKNGLIKKSITYQDTTEISWYFNWQTHHNRDPLFGEREHDSTFFVKTLDSLRHLKYWSKEVHIVYTYDNNGRNYKSLLYGYRGNLEGVSSLDWDMQIYEHHNFYKSGRIEIYAKYDQLNNKQVEFDYKEDGTVKNFTGDCELCMVFLGRTLPPAATPEKIYIQ
jgi:antitoxin component YwqK of YwqJK toxin-antitoxin module